ncbi:1-deoxy-D-xylulose-5-phosphate synthase [Phycisphaera mikurensis]|uniref:1-deoxy-D-xylulose-5-phosphate synthase n=1 Tax=Phycisphaera mikurensis (strain NBRC 102666 / KCTC 22515 / FYK2301M01) TaxID=1142394 RepID=I0II34_PHYMF|nr:1-deoxy-D-xylulose-5-phosphate synthase [Phycisphaera mikurensis]MBB6442515.1 1-deoxy-D-xylulose-5-phosphate synthase [Phycisphaera mikurensis]BAM04922.1 1-deoxy-D-xylulose-5-phosphate synthase [Phycisphaera mikurensis NBRC 102666]
MPDPAPLLTPDLAPADLRRMTVPQMETLAEEIRQAIIAQVMASGGHLAPNLGVVELTMALHRVFDFRHDRLLFDVGHQCYVHKLLTGRLGMLPKLRQKGGMAGFPEPGESPWDLFAVGHAGTGISTAVGMAVGDDFEAGVRGRDGAETAEPHGRKVAVLVGDASIVNGVSLEGLNAAGTLKRQFLTVLNDNGMSIAHPQGALANYFDHVRVSRRYRGIKRRAKGFIDRLPGGEPAPGKPGLIEDLYQRGSDVMKALVRRGHMFEHFGHLCLGPVDGHDLSWLIEVLEEVRLINRPVLLHVKTTKGKGFREAEGDATRFHSPAAFRLVAVEGGSDIPRPATPSQVAMNACRVEHAKKGRSFTAAFADALADRMAADPSIVAVTAAMPDGTGLAEVARRHPQRVIDTGICESHAADLCAGMAKSGVRPFFAVYSTFSQRAFDQFFQEVSLQGLAVRVCMDRAGYVGGDGAVHHGFLDVSLFRGLPGAVLLAASDEPNLVAALRFMADRDESATFLRYPRDTVAEQPAQASVPPFVLGRANLVSPARGGHAGRPEIAVLAYGTVVQQCRSALAVLREHGHEPALYDARFAKPVDVDLLRELLGSGVPVLTVEDHALAGGFGAAVLEAAHAEGLDTRLVKRLAMPEAWAGPDSRDAQLGDAGLDPASIAEAARGMLAKRTHESVQS